MKPKILMSVILTLGIVAITTDKNNQEEKYQINQIQKSSAGDNKNNKPRITLSEARINSEKRQEYLDTLVTVAEIPYCNEIIYDNDGSKILEYTKQDLIAQHLDNKTVDFILSKRKIELKEKQYFAMTPQPYFTRGENEYGTIFIGPDLFRQNSHQINDDYKATIAHEARHLFQHAKGLPLDYILNNNNYHNNIKELMFKNLLKVDNFEMVGEIDAYHHVLQRIKNGEFLVSGSYLISITNRYDSIRKNIETNIISSSSSLEKVFLTTALDVMKKL